MPPRELHRLILTNSGVDWKSRVLENYMYYAPGRCVSVRVKKDGNQSCFNEFYIPEYTDCGYGRPDVSVSILQQQCLT